MAYRSEMESGDKFCVHCQQYVADRTYRTHRTLYLTKIVQSQETQQQQDSTTDVMEVGREKVRIGYGSCNMYDSATYNNTFTLLDSHQ